MSDAKRMMVSPAEAATMLDVNKETILIWIRTGRLPAARLSKRIIRIRVSDIDAMLEKYAA